MGAAGRGGLIGVALRADGEMRLGRSELRVTRLGLGTAPLGGLFEAVDAHEAARPS